MALEILPGATDVHVHFREPGPTHKEDFETGTKAALAGGVLTAIDMPNNPGRPTINIRELSIKQDLGRKKAYNRLGFHFGATLASSVYFDRVAPYVFAYKIYRNHTTGDQLVLDPGEAEEIVKRLPPAKWLMCHAEGEKLHEMLQFGKKHHKKIYSAHTVGEDISMIEKAKEERPGKVACGVTPHHLFLTENDAKRLGGQAEMMPKLRDQSDVDTLWRKKDVWDIVETDHAPHLPEEKEKFDPDHGPYGIPGLETMVPLGLNAVHEGRLTLEEWVKLTSTNPNRLFRVQVLNIKRNYVEVDTDEEWEIDASKFQSKAKFTPFQGWKVRGRVKRVVMNGQTVFNGENIVGKRQGKVIYPKAA